MLDLQNQEILKLNMRSRKKYVVQKTMNIRRKELFQEEFEKLPSIQSSLERMRNIIDKKKDKIDEYAMQ